MLSRLTRSEAELEAADLQEDSRERGASRVCDCQPGKPSTVTGTLRSVTIRPRANVPTLEAELYDGSGRLTLVWLGRRRIGGIEPGRGIVVTGRVTTHEGRPLIYNPRYELLPVGE